MFSCGDLSESDPTNWLAQQKASESFRCVPTLLHLWFFLVDLSLLLTQDFSITPSETWNPKLDSAIPVLPIKSYQDQSSNDNATVFPNRMFFLIERFSYQKILNSFYIHLCFTHSPAAWRDVDLLDAPSCTLSASPSTRLLLLAK